MLIRHCVVIFYGPQGSWIVCCLHLKLEFRSLGGVSGVVSFKTEAAVSHAGYAS